MGDYMVMCYFTESMIFREVKEKPLHISPRPGEKRRRGGQPDNKNAVANRGGAPLGNKNAWKHGIFSRYLQVKPMYPWEFEEVHKAQARMEQKQVEGIAASFANGLLTLDAENQIHLNTEKGDFVIGYVTEAKESPGTSKIGDTP